MTVYLGDKAVGVNTIVGVDKKKYGATVNSFLGNVDENGVLQAANSDEDIVISGIKDLASYAFFYKFYNGAAPLRFILETEKMTGVGCLRYAFRGNTKLQRADIICNEISVNSAMEYAFGATSALTDADIRLEYATGSYVLRNTFNGSNIRKAKVSAVELNGTSICESMFSGCELLEDAIIVAENIIGTSACKKMFSGCTVLPILNMCGVRSIQGTAATEDMIADCNNLRAVDLDSLESIKGTNACSYLFNVRAIESLRLRNLVEVVGNGACDHMFNANSSMGYYGEAEIDLSRLTTVSGDLACQYMFNECIYIDMGDGLLSLANVSGEKACYYMFYNAKAVRHAGLRSLVTVTGSYTMGSMFSGCIVLEDTGLENLEVIGSFDSERTLYGMFRGATALKSSGFTKLQAVYGAYAASNMFYNCSELEDAGLSTLKYINGTGACNSMFSGCKLSSVSLDNLAAIYGKNAVNLMFNKNIGLTRVDFPMLVKFDRDSFSSSATSTTSGMFGNCTGITEIHFRSDVQAQVEATIGYANKWGAINAAVYFDLDSSVVPEVPITAIVVNEVVYYKASDTPQPGPAETWWYPWKSTDGITIYTSSNEPTVGQFAYSDVEMTEAGTITAVK